MSAHHDGAEGRPAPWIVRLERGSACSVSAVGGKAVGVFAVIDHGLLTANGACVTTAAYRHHVAACGLQAAIDRLIRPTAAPTDRESISERLRELRHAFCELPLAPRLLSDLAGALPRFSAERWAVRSSATCEDLEDTTFAGLHDTYLNVVGWEALATAVRSCWASLWSERAFHYRHEMGFDHAECAMAVLVQELVPAECSGVAFTQDPTNTNSEHIVIEASWGLGEGLVSGRVNPDRFVLARGDLALRSTSLGEKHLQVSISPTGGTVATVVPSELARLPSASAATLTEVATAALDLERVLGGAVDVEWAFADGRVYVLQVRRVSGLSSSNAAGVAPGPKWVWSNLNAGEVLPDVVTPLTWSLVERVGVIIGSLLRRVGIDVGESPLVGLVGGRAYFCLSTLAAVLRRAPFGRNVDLRRALGGFAAPGELGDPLAIPRAELPAVRAGWLRVLCSAPRALVWFVRHSPARGAVYLERLRRARLEREVDASRASSNTDRLATVTQIVAGLLGSDALLAYPAVGASYFDVLDQLAQRWLGDAPGRSANALLVGQGSVSSAEAGHELWQLAAEAYRTPEVAAVIGEATSFDLAVERLGQWETGRRFLARWGAFDAEHGHHARGELELRNPRWSERHDDVLATLRSYLAVIPERDPVAEWRTRGERAREHESECLRQLRGRWRRAVFRFVLRRARAGLAVRENVKSEAVRHLALVRRLLLAIGQSCCASGAFSDPDDIFFLTLAELPTLVRDPQDAALRKAIRRRRREYHRNESLRPPPVVIGDWLRDPQPPGPLASTPIDASSSAGSGETLRGVAVSPGVATGRARVIEHASTTERLEPGEILVAPFTDPGWTPYFIPAAGIVMDLGGLLSHGSIVAREYGIPAVVNVGVGTRRIRTGDWVRVDGERGEVQILESAPGPGPP
ncbi:MAG: PEP/pyruvate-binding domain-containing protein [Planctomycetota bacterium]